MYRRAVPTTLAAAQPQEPDHAPPSRREILSTGVFGPRLVWLLPVLLSACAIRRLLIKSDTSHGRSVPLTRWGNRCSMSLLLPKRSAAETFCCQEFPWRRQHGVWGAVERLWKVHRYPK